MTARIIMVQGTGSSVGKSLLVTALCRILKQDGYSVSPFKAQNMSLNSCPTPDGAEIGRAQAVQAQAAGVLPTACMNPILLKPEADYRSQLVVMGRPYGRLDSRNFNRRKDDLWHVVTSALDSLRSQYDVVVVEGAGSPAEINLRQGDIVNMEVALYASAPVLLVGDIDKGGVFASLYGTLALIEQRERDLVRGLIINKFRGDISILEPGLRQLEALAGVPVLGVVPYFSDIYIPEEDSPAAHSSGEDTPSLIDIAVIALPRIANFDDFDPLRWEPGVRLRYVRSAAQLGRPDLVIIPGTKTTVADLKYLTGTGIADELMALAREGTAFIGICGGYQMLGQRILDPDAVESDQAEVAGLGLLPVVTTFLKHKETHQVTGHVTAGHGLLEALGGLPIKGYEIHMGDTLSSGASASPFQICTRSDRPVEVADGCLSDGGWILGTYIHGLFHNDALRRSILQAVARRKGVSLPPGGQTFSQDREFDRLAELVRRSVQVEAIYGMMGLRHSYWCMSRHLNKGEEIFPLP